MIYLVLSVILLFYSFYMFSAMVAAMFYKPAEYPANTDFIHPVLVFYPAYKPDRNLIKNLAFMKKELIGLNASIYVLSQEGGAQINAEIKNLADYVDEKAFSHLNGNSYHHALEYAVNRISEFEKERGANFDSVLLMDPDNRMDAISVSRLIQGRKSGAHVVLSQRKSANAINATSIFDGLAERLNDYMFRRAKDVVKLTPELSGSGMLMETSLFKKAVIALDKKAPGMDKQLLINMMFGCESLLINYDEKAIVSDEKTTDAKSFNRQRLRWFGNQYYNAKKFGWKLITSGRKSLIDYAIVLFRPPRSFQILATMLFVPIDLAAFYFGMIVFPIVTISAIISACSVVLFLISEGRLKTVVKALPAMFLTSVVNGFTVLKSLKPGNQGSFIHTRNS